MFQSVRLNETMKMKPSLFDNVPVCTFKFYQENETILIWQKHLKHIR